MDVLFAYGTLLYPHLLRRLLGRLPDTCAAELDGYARYTVRGENYPGLVPEDGTVTPGALFYGLTPREWGILDRYESEVYERRLVTTRRVDGQSCQAYAYVVPPPHRHLLSDTPWDPIQPPLPTETN